MALVDEIQPPDKPGPSMFSTKSTKKDTYGSESTRAPLASGNRSEYFGRPGNLAPPVGDTAGGAARVVSVVLPARPPATATSKAETWTFNQLLTS